MENQAEKKRKRAAAIITLAFHAIVLVLFFLFGLKQPVPLPEDQGASIAFGWDANASGDAVADIENDPANTSTPSETTMEEAEADKAEEEVIEQAESEIAVPSKKEPKPKVKPDKTPEQTQTPVEEPKPTISDKLNNALNSLGQTGGGGSKGDTQGSGNQGDPKGTTGSGALGGGSGSWQLDGRSMMPGFGTKIRDTKEEGIVVLNISVDRNGNVTQVSPNLKESNTTSSYLINLAKNDVLNNFKFNSDASAAVEQRGKVRYVFQLK